MSAIVNSHKNSPQILNPETTLALHLNGVKLIEASAGTGKTYTISNLYLRYVLEGRTVDQILVVTFTNAATEELRGRIRERLYQTLRLLEHAGQSEDDFLRLLLQRAESLRPEELKKWIDLLRLAVRSMDEASISTIHGFCQRALTDHAFNSGQAFDVEMSNDDEAFWVSALTDWWRRTAYPMNDFELSLLLSALESLPNLIQLQRPLRMAQDKTLLPETNESLDELMQGLAKNVVWIKQQWREHSTELTRILSNSGALKRGPYKQEVLDPVIQAMQQFSAEDGSCALPEKFNMFTSGQLHKDSKPTQKGKDPELEHPFFKACQKLLDDSGRQLKACALGDASEYAQAHIQKSKQQSQTISFNDQLTLLLQALHGPQGEALAQSLRQRLTVAMIDEFQDTDSVQYGIFSRLYLYQPETALIMIGDPKQAIYSFRGSDIFSYMQAREDAIDHRYTLDTNWRSVPGLIDGVNAIFANRPDPFIYAEAIEFNPVMSAFADENKRPADYLMRDGERVKPLTLWKIPLKPDGKPQSKGEVSDAMALSTAAEIATLIKEGQSGRVTIGQRALRAGDIAVLVRSGHEGAALRKQLLRLGIAVVSVGRDKVFQTDEAKSLHRLLKAVIQHKDRAALREGLSSALLGYSYVDIAAIIDDEGRWAEYAAEIAEFNRLWLMRGFMPMFQQLLKGLSIGLRIASRGEAERRLTNLLQLAELLQQASRVHPGHVALLGWYQQQMEQASDEAEMRMESDEALVKIVTIHTSKGLEYPVVFLPWMWTCRRPTCARRLIAYHDDEHRGFLDCGADENSESCRRFEKERLAEDLRLAYVALTRARVKLYLAWGWVNTGGNAPCNSGSSALAYLLHPIQSAQQLNKQFPSVFGSKSKVDIDIDQDMKRLMEVARHSIEIAELPEAGLGQAVALGDGESLGLSAKAFEGRVSSDWRVSSFSGLTRDIHQTAHGGSARTGLDPILDFPAGSHVGLFLHLLLEKLDFSRNINEQTRALTQQHATRFGLDKERYSDTICDWMEDVMRTALNDQGLRLSELTAQQRLNELPFDFSIDHLDIGALNRLLDQSSKQTLAPLVMEDFRGMMSGVIDLVFEYQGRYYIADYKSNYLGGSLQDYAPDKLQTAVYDRRYDLQYLLYCLALHRYLKTRLADYQYERHFGGAFYLFLRGMREDSGPAYGVYFDLPEFSLIETLDKEIFGEGAAQ